MPRFVTSFCNVRDTPFCQMKLCPSLSIPLLLSGESEAALKGVFAAARALAPSVIFIDEVWSPSFWSHISKLVYTHFPDGHFPYPRYPLIPLIPLSP